MSLFGKIVRTAVNVATIPVAVAKDVVTLGNAANRGWYGCESYTTQKLKQIKEEAED